MEQQLLIIDNFLSQEDHYKIWEYCNRESYKPGEKDQSNLPPTGIVHEISIKSDINSIFTNILYSKVDILKKYVNYRSYINCFTPGENPYWHQDGKGYTCLYYPNIKYNELNEGGETQFLIDGPEIKGILPISNRMIIFNGLIYHRATSFRTQHRYTIAIKFGPPK
jgi:hypothetical protein